MTDNDATRFLTYVVAALRTIAADIGEGVLGALESPQPPPNASILTDLPNEIATVEYDFVLVLDDYQVIDDQTEPVRRFLLQTSILDRLSGPLCDAVIDQKESSEQLEALERG